MFLHSLKKNKKQFFLAVFFLLSLNISCIQAQDKTETKTENTTKVAYHFDFSNRVHHTAKVTISVPKAPKDEPLKLRMSRSSAGRYALHEFAKNVYSVNAFDAKGNKLEIVRTSPYTWNIPKASDNMKVEYTLFADYADGTYSGINTIQVHLNAPATYLLVDNFYDENFEKDASIRKNKEDKDAQTIKVTFSLPQNNSFKDNNDEKWTVATQLSQINDSTFYAPNYYYLLDAPVLIGNLFWSEWKEANQNFRVALNKTGTETTDQEAKEYVEKIKKIVKEEIALFGEAPNFDYGTYTFLLNYQPTAHGDGMEHRNSTIITDAEKLADGHLFTVAHEFIHAWNIERLRPQSLEPFDFSSTNMSSELWFGEGFTSYYTNLVMLRAGLIDETTYANLMNGMLNYVLTSPGHNFHSPAQMSQQATFADAATANDPLSHYNTFITYYYYGGVMGLALDMEMRKRFDKSLDDYMQQLWKQFGKTEKPYTMRDLQRTLAEVTNDKQFAEGFFNKHIEGHELPNYNELLSTVAMDFQLTQKGKVWFGKLGLDIDKKKTEKNATISNYMLYGSPFYEAGLEKGDVLVSIDNKLITSMNDYREVLSTLEKGKAVRVTYERFGKKNSVEVMPVQIPYRALVYLAEDEPITRKEQVEEREDWLSTKQK
ncbi:M61 family metallopeptidase [Bernardetia sp. OM2101]|uniref:M61 family metallopeptidase n=1 Tax=Bernardetia sp. OM2101 TaxID=3344876 RepID=UPI0035CEAD68